MVRYLVCVIYYIVMLMYCLGLHHSAVDNEVERWCNAFVDTLSEKYDDIMTTIHMYGKPYLEALNVLNYRLDELSEILDVKISTVEKVIGVLHKF